jgi:hypothetical protein
VTDAPLPLVHLRHARMIRRPNGRPVCRPGVEALCRRYGIDWKAFTTTGVPGELFHASGDRFALRALANAIQEQADGQ